MKGRMRPSAIALAVLLALSGLAAFTGRLASAQSAPEEIDPLTVGSAGAAARSRRAVRVTAGGIAIGVGREPGIGPEGVTPRPKPSRTPSLLEATPRGTPIALGVDTVLEEAMRNGEDLILNRQYDEALVLFESIDASHPASALGPLGKMLVYQSQMLENGDFAFDKEYEAVAKITGARVAASLSAAGDDVWDRMLAGGYYGVRGMHAMRKKSYLKSVDDGWEALSYLKWIKKKEPYLADTDLGLGAYDYWRSVITKSVSWLPFFPDKRKSGIAAIERSFVDAQYTRPVSQLILVYVYIDEKRFGEAIELAEDMAARYPRNTLVRVQLGRAYSRKARYADAIKILHEVETLQPDNKVVGYYLGANYLYQGRDLDTSEAYLRKFITDAPGTEWRGWGYERLGDLFMKRQKPETAIEYWKKAQRDNPDDEQIPKKIERARKWKPRVTPVPTATPAASPIASPS